MTKMTKTNLWHQLREDESGFLISSELVIIGTVGVLAMIVGLEAVSSAVTQELNDLSNALGAINQSYSYRSIAKFRHAWVSGSRFNDTRDRCDCVAITQTDVVGICGLGTGVSESTGDLPSPVIQEEVIRKSIVPSCP